MNFRPPLQKLLLGLGVLAVMAAQLFGIGNGFLCDCSGRSVFTASDHCDGPHGAHCHQNGASPYSQESHPDSDDTRSHVRALQDFRSTPAPVAELLLVEPVLHILLTLDDAEWTNELCVRDLEWAARWRENPPSGVAVSRTVVLLI